jgi:hypothetical protein
MEDPFKDAPIISQYTSNDAENDGILVQTSTLLPEHNGYAPHVISHITTNLLDSEGYFTHKDGRTDYSRANIVDLLNQAGPKIQSALEKDENEYFLSMNLEGPRGSRYEAYAAQNEYHRWTLMLPADY